MATILAHTSCFVILTTTCPITIFSYSRPRITKKSFSMLSSNHREYIPNHIHHPNYVRVFYTTLRDGEQAPGATMTPTQKLNIARQLAKLGVDIIEVGFPASSKADLETIKLIAQEVGNTTNDDGWDLVICAFARCTKKDIDKAWECLKDAKFPRINMFLATSDIHMKYKLRMSKEEVIAKARSAVAYARSLGCNDIEFTPEDAGRSEKEFLYAFLGEVIKAGTTTINIADTVGYNFPREFGQLITDIKSNTPGIENVIISTHCHNDLGLATANTLEGAYSGARQVEVTINGIGERAGNASLEEVIMAIKCRGELLGGLYTGVNRRHIVMTSKMETMKFVYFLVNPTFPVSFRFALAKVEEDGFKFPPSSIKIKDNIVGGTWTVSLRRYADGEFAFYGESWLELGRVLSMQFGMLLEFEPKKDESDEPYLEMTVYAPDGSEITGHPTEGEGDASTVEEVDDALSFIYSASRSFMLPIDIGNALFTNNFPPFCLTFRHGLVSMNWKFSRRVDAVTALKRFYLIGWRQIMVDHGIEYGDVCKFEYLKSEGVFKLLVEKP